MIDIKPVYLKELNKYTIDDFKRRINGTDKEKDKEIELLLSHNILKRAGGSNLGEAEPDELDAPAQGNEKFLAIKYVGVIITQHNIICSYPKYISKETENLTNDFIKVLEVIKRLNRRELKLTLAHDTADTNNMPILAIILEIIRQYMANGLYIKNEQIQEFNGDGEINWERTIGETEAMLMKNRPFYPDMYTEQNQWNENDYFHRLHKCIVAECYQYINSYELAKMLNINGDMKYNKKLNDFGSTKVIIQKLKKELANQFVTWKKIAIRLMIAYLNKSTQKHERQSIVYYGTNAINITWEKACAAVLGNQMDVSIMNIKHLDDEAKKQYKDTLGKIIEHPIWVPAEALAESGPAADTLIPDTVAVKLNKDNKLLLVIYDAKYYNIRLTSDSVSGQPGIESITKQYLYHLAYKDFMEKSGINEIENVFLFPTEGPSCDIGYVTLPMMAKLGLKNIGAIKLNANYVWDTFLKGEQKELHELLDYGRNDTSPAPA